MTARACSIDESGHSVEAKKLKPKTYAPITSGELRACSIDETCAVAGVKKTKIYEMINSGELPAKKLGRKTVILTSDIEAFFKGLKPFKTGEAQTKSAASK